MVGHHVSGAMPWCKRRRTHHQCNKRDDWFLRQRTQSVHKVLWRLRCLPSPIVLCGKSPSPKLAQWPPPKDPSRCRDGVRTGQAPCPTFQHDANSARRTWIEAGYCLDAPELIAAGSHERDVFDDDPDIGWLPMPTMVEREPSNVLAQGRAACGASLGATS